VVEPIRPLAALLPELPWDLPLGGEQRWGRLGDVVVCVKRTRTRRVLRLPLRALRTTHDAGDDAVKVYAKRYANPINRPWRSLLALVGISKARREAAANLAVGRRGFVVPEPLAWATRWGASYLLTAELPGLTTLGEALRAMEPAKRRELWRAAGAYTRLVWERGVFHPDYLQEHLCLYRPEASASAPSSQPSFALIDLDGVRLMPDGAGVESAGRHFNAMQVLRSIPVELGGDDERRAFLVAAFEDAWPAQERIILEAIDAVAKREGTTTHIEHWLR